MPNRRPLLAVGGVAETFLDPGLLPLDRCLSLAVSDVLEPAKLSLLSDRPLTLLRPVLEAEPMRASVFEDPLTPSGLTLLPSGGRKPLLLLPDRPPALLPPLGVAPPSPS